MFTIDSQMFLDKYYKIKNLQEFLKFDHSVVIIDHNHDSFIDISNLDNIQRD